MCDCDYPPILQAMASTIAYKSLLLPQHRAHLYKHSATPFEGSMYFVFLHNFDFLLMHIITLLYMEVLPNRNIHATGYCILSDYQLIKLKLTVL